MAHLRSISAELRSRFPRAELTELGSGGPRNGQRRASRSRWQALTKRDGRWAAEVTGARMPSDGEAAMLPEGYAQRAKAIAERRLDTGGVQTG